MTQLLVIDTETGGLDPLVHSILSVGAVVWRDQEFVDSIEILVREDSSAHIDPEAMRINRIDLTRHRQHGLSPARAVQELLRFLQPHFGSTLRLDRVALVGHNVSFDVGFLKRLFRLAGANFDDVFSHRVLDTASVIRFLSLAGRLPLESAGSDAAFRYFGISLPNQQRHTALGDALATAELLNHLLRLVASNPAVETTRERLR